MSLLGIGREDRDYWNDKYEHATWRCEDCEIDNDYYEESCEGCGEENDG